MTFALKQADIQSVLDLLSKISGAPILFDRETVTARGLFTASLKDLVLADLLELATLPYGLDVRIEKGQAVVFERPR